MNSPSRNNWSEDLPQELQDTDFLKAVSSVTKNTTTKLPLKLREDTQQLILTNKYKNPSFSIRFAACAALFLCVCIAYVSLTKQVSENITIHEQQTTKEKNLNWQDFTQSVALIDHRLSEQEPTFYAHYKEQKRRRSFKRAASSFSSTKEIRNELNTRIPSHLNWSF